MHTFDAERKAFAQALGALRDGGDRLELAAWLRRHLFGHVLPFWERHGRIGERGIATCLRNDGSLASEDRWLWSQWRAVWVFSRLHRGVGAGGDIWLERARLIAAFCRQYGWLGDEQGWALVVGGNGEVLRRHESTYVDAFAIYGLVELYRASGEAEWLELARRTGDVALRQLEAPYDSIPHFPYPIPQGAKPHGIPMLWSLTFAELGEATGEERWRSASVRLSEEIFRDYWREDRGLMLEFVRLDGGEYAAPQGRSVVPGHVIEDAWFQGACARLTGHAVRTPAQLWALAARHLDLGWDAAQGGGILLAVNADGAEELGWKFPDTKLWWPHTEALYTSLLGWKDTGNAACLDWYERVWCVCLERFVDWKHGEWLQKLDRDFRPIEDVVALPVKDPFHLPRSLILQIETLESRD